MNSDADFERQVRSQLSLGAANGPILVGVSGGADSVALLVAASRSNANGEMGLVAAHVNHQLRGAESDADQRFVEQLSEQLHVPIDCTTVDVAALASDRGLSLEAAARDARYAALIDIAKQRRCVAVAIAHTADDQAETILHHIIRGTSLAGLRGMPARRNLADGIDLIRPLLHVSRFDVEAYLRELGQNYRTDMTNIDETFTRNRIRHTLLPLLRDDFNPRVNDALLRLADSAGDAEESLREIARRLLEAALLEESSAVCRLRCEPLIDQPRHLLRTLFTELWQRVGWPRQGMGFADWDRLAGVVNDSSAATLPGNIDARRRGDLVVLQRMPRTLD